MELLLVAIVFLLIGSAAGFVACRSRLMGITSAEAATIAEQLRQADARVDYLEAERNTLGHQAAELRERCAVLETQLDHARQNTDQRLANEERLTAEFEKLSKATLKSTSEELVKVAESTFKVAQQTAKGDFAQQQLKIEHMVKPVQENLTKLEQFIQNSEKARNEQFGGLFEQMQNVAATSRAVQTEAAQLKNVLRSSTSTRGRWGELQLRRVIELAGMVEHIDFSEQESASTDDGRSRADMIIYLPRNIKIAVDAKVPYDAFEAGHSTEDAAEQKRHFIEHAKKFRGHVDALAKRAYWDQYLPSCGFTILFVPGDSLLDVAMAHDPKLWEYAVQKQIVLATPSSLISMLRMAALGWAQEAQAENAAEITRVSKELLKRLTKANADVEKLGRGLKSAVGSYNDFIGTYEGRVTPQARKLAKLGGGDVELRELTELTEPPRELRNREIEDVEVIEITEHSEAS